MNAPIGRELAQRIVDQVSPTLAHNVNFIDPLGVIIASRDPGRIGTLHLAAKRAAETGEPILIRRGAEPAGTRAGANVPLVLDGATVAVIGVTGDPGDVLPLAQVLVLTAQLLLERERELGASALREVHDRELLAGLVGATSPSDAVVRALRTEPPALAPPWRLSAIVRVDEGAHAPGLPLGLNELTARLERLGRFRFAAFHHALWVLGRATDRDDEALRRACQGTGAVVVQGASTSDGHDLWTSGRAIAQLTANPGVLASRLGGLVVPVATLGAEVAVASAPEEVAVHLAGPTSGLSPAQRATVRAYLASGGSVTETARRLIVHRNTVVQRLDRIAALTGLDPRTPAHAAALHVALLAERRTPHDAQRTAAPER